MLIDETGMVSTTAEVDATPAVARELETHQRLWRDVEALAEIERNLTALRHEERIDLDDYAPAMPHTLELLRHLHSLARLSSARLNRARYDAQQPQVTEAVAENAIIGEGVTRNG